MARLVCCTALYSYAKFAQILEVLWNCHRLFGFRNSPTTGILHTTRHVYRSVWPAREAKPRFGAKLICSAHDQLWKHNVIKILTKHLSVFNLRKVQRLPNPAEPRETTNQPATLNEHCFLLPSVQF